MMVNSVNLTGLRDAQIAGKTLFLDMSVIMFLEVITIWIGTLSQTQDPPWCKRPSSNLLIAWMENKSG